jgi:hypothetical protein
MGIINPSPSDSLSYYNRPSGVGSGFALQSLNVTLIDLNVWQVTHTCYTLSYMFHPPGYSTDIRCQSSCYL